MALSIRTTERTARATVINTALGASALIRFYSGAAPANVNATATGTLLAECTCNSTAFGTVSSGVLTASNVVGESYVARDPNANATGTIGYARVCTSGGTAILQESDVGTSGTAILLPTLNVTLNQPVEVTSFVLTEGNV